MGPTEEYIETPGADAMQRHFGLSYAAYLTIPRSVLQSMSDEWQGDFAVMLEELDDAVIAAGIEWPPNGTQVVVLLKPGEKKINPTIEDDLADYQRGRRQLW